MLWDLFLMKFLLKKEICGSYKQCMGPTRNTKILLKCTSKKKEKGKHRCIHRIVLFNTIQMHTFFWEACFSKANALLIGHVHCSWDSQTFFLVKTFIKNGSHGTIHILNNYFVIVFSVFSFQKNKKYPNTPIVYACVWIAFLVLRLRFPSSSFLLFIFIFFIEKCISRGILSISGSYALCTGPTTSLSSKILTRMCLSVGPVHYSRDPQTFFFNKTFIKNGSHGTIHTFKNYFVTVFSVFSKISGITEP